MKRRPCWLRDLLDWAALIGGAIIIGLAIGVPIGLAVVWMWVE